jgi:hypothetical protein
VWIRNIWDDLRKASDAEPAELGEDESQERIPNQALIANKVAT